MAEKRRRGKKKKGKKIASNCVWSGRQQARGTDSAVECRKGGGKGSGLAE